MRPRPNPSRRLARAPGAGPEQRGQRQRVGDLIAADGLDDAGRRYPLHAVSFKRVARRADLLGAVGHDDVEPLVGEPVRRVVGRTQSLS
jgi:hypothetical protein